MTPEEHRERHRALHKALDELLADYLAHHDDALITNTSLQELIEWSYEQTQVPTPMRGER